MVMEDAMMLTEWGETSGGDGTRALCQCAIDRSTPPFQRGDPDLTYSDGREAVDWPRRISILHLPHVVRISRTRVRANSKTVPITWNSPGRSHLAKWIGYSPPADEDRVRFGRERVRLPSKSVRRRHTHTRAGAKPRPFSSRSDRATLDRTLRAPSRRARRRRARARIQPPLASEGLVDGLD